MSPMCVIMCPEADVVPHGSDLYTYCGISTSALVVFDWLITLGDEISYIWASPMKAASWLFMANRYLLLTSVALSLVTLGPVSSQSCTVIQWIFAICLYSGDLVAAVFSACRAYALSRQSKALAIITLILASAPLIMNCIHFSVWIQVVNLPAPLNCSVQDNAPPSLSWRLLVFTRACQLVADLLVVAVTWKATKHIMQNQDVLGGRPSYSMVLLVNGGASFVILAVLNIMHIVLSLLSIEPEFSTGSYADPFLTMLSPVLISRFLLALQKVNHTMESSGDMPTLPSLAFAGGGNLPAFIASFGDPMPIGITARTSCVETIGTGVAEIE
ncbi:hypothetical protein OH77DRAFT_1512835 [Trametes cingulata]|nr:hypothetical protein OH77DRAFT_1512835 [Trametes cingulata]